LRAHNLDLKSTFNNAKKVDFIWREFSFSDWTHSEDFKASELHKAHENLEKEEEKTQLFDFLVAKLGYNYKDSKVRASVLENIYYKD